ncbi:MAG: DEAD/DEAH box helicase [Candidatus Bathyarchaeota archaeon]|nr:DEAD/DEAH box helicase [Candidatus Bathyarchaeota archaeon]MDH5494493.1 DEAD/DEAH box helicase [Candidatus Bathyarchaeota archaeon]
MKVEELPIPEQVKEVIIKSGISKLYPPQKEAIRAGALEGKDLVLASPTASGKTLTAELCALKHVVERGGKVLYLTPLRALASEKYQDFKKYSSVRKRNKGRVSVGISTGDYDSSDPWLERYDIIVSTNEKADSLLRHRSKWMDEISLVVADEVHLLNDSERGPTLEVVLARLMQINPEIQILALSATIKNVEELADWLKAQYVTTEWRPVTLKEGVLLHQEIQFKDGGAVKIGKHARNPALNLAIHIIKSGGQALIFASTRKNAVSLAKKTAAELDNFLSKPTKRSLNLLGERILATGERTRISELLASLVRHGAAFHHAGLGGGHRKLLEDAFREGKIKVLSATPTLAFGVNLPARMVIIHDYRRYEVGYGYYPIAVLEYKQMAGRAGRPKYDKVGEAILIAKTDDEQDYLMESYVLAEPERIWSKLAVERILRPHVLSTIAAKYAQSEQGVYDFFGKTFYAYQYDPKAIRLVITKILKFLYDEEMIDVSGKDVFATKFGRRVSELYIDPVSAVFIRDALYARAPVITDISFLHMMAHTPDIYPKLRPYASEIDELALFVDQHKDEFMFDVPREVDDRLDFEEFLGEAKLAWVLQSWIEEVTEDQMIERFRVQPGDLYRLINSSKWLLYASCELAGLLGQKDLVQRLNMLMERSGKGVKTELLPLVRLEGVGRARARILFNSGLKTVEDLKHAPVERLMGLPLIGSRVAKKIKEQVGGFVKSEQWKKLAKDETPEQQSLTEYY